MIKVFVADPAIRAEQIEAIENTLPADWVLSDSPSCALAILTEDVDISSAMLAEAGQSLRPIVLLDTGNATIAATTTPIVELPNTALVGVTEHAVMLIMALSRHLFAVTRATNERQWLSDRAEPILTDQQRYTYNWIGPEDLSILSGKTVGFIGLGLIGRATAAQLRPLASNYSTHRATDSIIICYPIPPTKENHYA